MHGDGDCPSATDAGRGALGGGASETPRAAATGLSPDPAAWSCPPVPTDPALSPPTPCLQLAQRLSRLCPGPCPSGSPPRPFQPCTGRCAARLGLNLVLRGLSSMPAGSPQALRPCQLPSGSETDTLCPWAELSDKWASFPPQGFTALPSDCCLQALGRPLPPATLAALFLLLWLGPFPATHLLSETCVKLSKPHLLCFSCFRGLVLRPCC